MKLTRRSFLRRATLSLAAAPLFASPRVFGANDRITMGGIGMGG